MTFAERHEIEEMQSFLLRYKHFVRKPDLDFVIKMARVEPARLSNTGKKMLSEITAYVIEELS